MTKDEREGIDPTPTLYDMETQRVALRNPNLKEKEDKIRGSIEKLQGKIRAILEEINNKTTDL